MITLDCEYSYPLHMTGQASTLPSEDDKDDIVKRLHAVVEEVTGIKAPVVAKNPIGFIW